MYTEPNSLSVAQPFHDGNESVVKVADENFVTLPFTCKEADFFLRDLYNSLLTLGAN